MLWTHVPVPARKERKALEWQEELTQGLLAVMGTRMRSAGRSEDSLRARALYPRAPHPHKHRRPAPPAQLPGRGPPPLRLGGGRQAPPSADSGSVPSALHSEEEPPGGNMEGAAGDPYRRPARRTQWLLSALAHHYGLDRGVENEIVVLATGLDQYLQEVFHHLDCRGAGRLPRSDFRALCAVLGLSADGEADAEEANSSEAASEDAAAPAEAGADADAQEEARLALRADPPELTFRQFHARLCGYFSTRAGPRLPRGALSEHIETQIHLRRPRRRRPPGAPRLQDSAYCERMARLEEENSSLRELVEDLRAALQSSDARCLALQVGLWKSQSGVQEAGVLELQRAQSALAAAETRIGRLHRRQVEVRLRTEAARQAVVRSLQRVRELEDLVRRVPRLQRQVQRLEAKLRRYRSAGSQILKPQQASPQPGHKSDELKASRTRDADTTPEGAWQSDSSWRSRAPEEAEDEQLFRSVEGQAASEEDEEETWQEKSRPPDAQARMPLVQPLGHVSRCEDQTAEKLSFGHCGDADRACSLELETHVTKLEEQLQTPGCSRETLGTPGEEAELQQMVDTEHLRLELQMVETERVRLSLLEEKLVDVLQLLQRLRNLRTHVAPRLSWTPCTKPWLAVNSCGDSPQHQHPQLLNTATPSSSPAEVPGPASGHPGHFNHHQISLGHHWTSLHSQPDNHGTSLLSHSDQHQTRLHSCLTTVRLASTVSLTTVRLLSILRTLSTCTLTAVSSSELCSPGSKTGLMATHFFGFLSHSLRAPTLNSPRLLDQHVPYPRPSTAWNLCARIPAFLSLPGQSSSTSVPAASKPVLQDMPSPLGNSPYSSKC